MSIIVNLLARALFMSTPLILGAIGEVIAERTGMMVTAVEGIFLIGAWGGFIGAYTSGSIMVGFLVAILCGICVAAIYGLTTIYMLQHQVVMGTAISILVTGFCTFFYRVIFGTPTSPLTIDPLAKVYIPILSDIPIIGPIIFQQNIITYITIIFVGIAFWVLYRTSLGLTIRSCGENPEAVDAAGIDVRKVRFLAVLTAGGLGGIAGAYYSVCNVGMYTSEIINGRGWIAFGICFLGNWTPKGAMLAGIIFGLSEALGVYVKALGSNILPTELFSALPYLLVIILTILRKQFNVPNKLGVNFEKAG